MTLYLTGIARLNHDPLAKLLYYVILCYTYVLQNARGAESGDAVGVNRLKAVFVLGIVEAPTL